MTYLSALVVVLAIIVCWQSFELVRDVKQLKREVATSRKGESK